MRVVVAGASGLIGRAVTDRLRARGDSVVRLVRRETHNDDEAGWNPADGVLDAEVVDGADAVVNLTGASIGRLPWTKGYRRQIRSSRVETTRTLVTAIRGSTTRPGVFLNASAVGYYGSRPGERLTEASISGTGFLSNVVQQWEWEAMRAADLTRVVTSRSGIVITTGGVLSPLMLMAKAGLAGPLAGGRQHWPWISLDDEAAALLHVIDGSIEGPVNLTGPIPATAGELTRHLAERLNRPYWLPAPRFALELALGDAARDLLISDQLVVPEKLLADGFRFSHPTVESAIDALFSPE